MIKKISFSFCCMLFISLFLSSSNKKFEQPLQPVKQFKNYTFDKRTTLKDRVTEAPQFVFEYLIELDGIKEYKNYKLSKAEKDIVNTNIDLLPEVYKDELNKTLIGVYFIENLWGSGLTDFVVDENNKIYSIIFLNPKLLNLSLSEAYTMKENSCFIKDGNIRLEVELSDTLNGILYILLHETTHSIDYTKRITQYTHPELLRYTESISMPYITKDIWSDYNTVQNNYWSSNFKRVTFYGFNNGPYLHLSEAQNLYEDLEKTPFVSSYSTLSWAEDIAELFTIQYLINNLNCDYNIKIYENENLIYNVNLFDRELVQDRLVHNDLF